MTDWGGARRVWEGHPYAADAALAVAGFAVFECASVMADEPAPPLWLGTLLGLIAFSALAHRRRWPFPVLFITVAVTATYLLAGGDKSPLMLASTIAVYTVAANITRRLMVGKVGLGSATLLATAGVLGSDHGWLAPEILGLVLQCALAAAIGAAVQNRRAYLTEVERRARVAEETKEQEARRRVAEERLRIARDLHDVVAHHIAVINVQAGVAAHVLESDPEQAKEALAQVRKAGQGALDELRDTVGVLRRPDGGPGNGPGSGQGNGSGGGPGGGPEEPAPGLHRLPQLIASFEECGLETQVHAEGEPVKLPVAVDLAAYRILQEALTNVTKHSGSARATVRLAHLPDRLTVEVSDQGRGTEEISTTGHGLIGMRERALALGGTFSAAARPEGGFHIRAVLPVTVAT